MNGTAGWEEDPISGEGGEVVWRSGRERRIEVVVEDGSSGGAWLTRVDPLHLHPHMQSQRMAVAGPVSRSLTQVARIHASPATSRCAGVEREAGVERSAGACTRDCVIVV